MFRWNVQSRKTVYRSQGSVSSDVRRSLSLNLNHVTGILAQEKLHSLWSIFLFVFYGADWSERGFHCGLPGDDLIYSTEDFEAGFLGGIITFLYGCW